MPKKDQLLYHSKMLIYMLIFLAIFVTEVNGLEDNNSCVDCHKTISPFTEEQTRFNKIIINHTERNVSCSLDCHADIIRKTAINNYLQWSESAHANYLVTCDKCHGGNPDAKTEIDAHSGILNKTNQTSPIYFKNIPDTCGKCHIDELNNFKDTMHYQRLKAESLAPSCATCHRAHTFKVPATSDIVPLCGICHNKKNLPSLATIPMDAKDALDKANELQNIIIKTKESIVSEKSKGKDIHNAQLDIDSAILVTNDIPSMWHKFNLKNFDDQIQKGTNSVERAQNDLLGINTESPKIPNISMPIIFGMFILIYLILKKNYY